MQLILAHDHSDFDAVAAQVAMWKLCPEALPVLAVHVNRNVRTFLTLHWDALPLRRADELPDDATLRSVRLVDTQSLPSVKGLDVQAVTEVHVVDHHARRPDLPAHWNVQLDEVGSCTTLLVEALGERHLSLGWVEATLLLLGIHEDTGSLSYAGTTVRDLRAATWLLEQGADLDTLRRFLDHPLTERQRTLYRRLLEKSDFLDVHGFQLVVASATMEEYVDDVSSLAHNVRELYDPAALVLAVGMSGHVQLVARSTTDEVDVGRLMSDFGGGGHARAAAAFVEGQPLAEVVARLKARLPNHVRPAVTVRALMSRGRIRTLPASARIHEAAAGMQRWGHEGFPVVDEAGGVVGVLTRRDVDRARQHRLDNAPISEFMHKGAITVTPDDSIARVQRVMTEHNIGQLPVVAPTGEIVGIITRTDLLKRQERRQRDRRSGEMVERLGAALPAATLALVRRVAAEAASMGHEPFLVGGIVRDLLLGSAIHDLDIVIEGHAIPVARRLAAQLGGRVVAHDRFGTAKWLLPDDAEGGLPPHMDLITARTEFYERPTALPQVEHASIKQDLHRRDFTINTLALSLHPDHEGQLLDFYGGEADLRRGLVRVLHNLSFVEDPTRILRALRFEQRFGFTLEPRTAELLHFSLDLLDQVSPDRLRHELYLILKEPVPARALQRLDALGILPRLLPGVRWGEGDAERLARLRAGGITEPDELLAALIWDPAAPLSRIKAVADRLHLSAAWRVRQRALYALRTERAALVAAPLPNSALYHLLAPYEPRAVALLALLTEDEALRARLRLFLDDLHHRRLAVGGAELRARGLPPGPLYRAILTDIHAALLDGLAPDEATQCALLNAAVAQLKAE